jgi:hypothetical protein
MTQAAELDEQATTTAEDIETRIALAEEAAREQTVADILIDLEDWAKDFTGEQLAGFLAAIQVIESNHGRSES